MHADVCYTVQEVWQIGSLVEKKGFWGRGSRHFSNRRLDSGKASEKGKG